jgi:hypothetical protein
MTWENETDFRTIDELFARLFSIKDNSVACRGLADKDRTLLQTSLDRILDPNEDYKVRLAKEESILAKFRILAREYFSEFETKRLESNKISALTILQHYRAPTRLLDWTSSPWVALYFAAIDHYDKDGVIWWFKRKAFYDEVGQKWEKYGLRRHPEQNNEIDLNDTAFNTNGPPWITELNCVVPFHRIEVQQGFFTIAGRLGLEHGGLIADVLNEGQYGRIVVPASWKQEILNRLRIMNIHSKSLDYPGADIVGVKITQDLRNK